MCTASITGAAGEIPPFYPFDLVIWFGFFPHLVGGLIMNKSEILISEPGTPSLMCPFQEKGSLSKVRGRGVAQGLKVLCGSFFVLLIIVLIQRHF